MRPSNYIANLFLLTLAVSCVSEDYGDCEPIARWKHTVSVEDKNYSNGAQFGYPIAVVDESLPFSSYISTLTLWRHNTTLSDYRVYNADLTSATEVYDLSVESWPAGINRVTAIGNETDFSQTVGQSSATIPLHPEGHEHDDIYIGVGDVPIPPTADVDIKMRRTKGELVLFMEEIPESVVSLYITVDNLYSHVDGDMNYSGVTSVTKEFKVSDTEMTLTMILAPTVGAGSSNVSLTLVYEDGQRDSYDITSITMGDNDVSGIRERIDPTHPDGHVVHVYTNGGWSRVTPLDVIPQ